jgi:hypothetical protein
VAEIKDKIDELNHLLKAERQLIRAGADKIRPEFRAEFFQRADEFFVICEKNRSNPERIDEAQAEFRRWFLAHRAQNES